MTSPPSSILSTKDQPKAHHVKPHNRSVEGSCEDQRRGHCAYKSTETDESDETNITSEKDDSTSLLDYKVPEQNECRRQQEALLIWTEGNGSNVDLSFEEADHCEYVWDKIHEKPDDDDTPTLHADSDHADTPPIRENYESDLLPSPELSTLPQIEEALTNAKSGQQKDRFASFIVPENYIGKLVALFNTCEELKSIENLHKLYTIMKAIIMLDDNAIIEFIVRDDVYLGVMGILEYNPEAPTIRTKHREFLEKCSAMDPIVPIKDIETISMIHETHRIKYVKDIIFSNSLDSTLDSILNSLIFFNDRTIICNILKNPEFLSELSDIFNERTSATERKVEATKFMLELCNMAKNFQVGNRASLYRSLCAHGFLDMLAFALGSKPEGIRKSACIVLSSVAEMDSVFLRSQLFQNIKKNGSRTSLMAVLIDRFTMCSDECFKVQLFETIRLLLDVANGPKMNNLMTFNAIQKQEQEAEDFIYKFFDDFAASTFLQPFDALENREVKLDGPIDSLDLTIEQGNTFNYLCELLCIVIKQHSHESRTFFATADLSTKVLQLYRCKQGSLKLAALKFVRACVGAADNFYTERLIRSNAFEPTIRMLLDTNGRDNLLNSTCLELFEFIRTENIQPVVEHLYTRFRSVMESLTYTPTFKALLVQFDRNWEELERHRSGSSGWSSSTANCDDGDDEYINSPSDDAEKAVSSSANEKLSKTEDYVVKGVGITAPSTSFPVSSEEIGNIILDQTFSVIEEPQQIQERKRKRDGE